MVRTSLVGPDSAAGTLGKNTLQMVYCSCPSPYFFILLFPFLPTSPVCLAFFFLPRQLRTLQPLFSHNTTWSAMLQLYFLGMHALLLFSLVGNLTAKPSLAISCHFLSQSFLSKYIIYFLVAKMHFTLFNLRI